MNEAPHRKSHATLWTLAILMVMPLLYIASWPLVQIGASDGTITLRNGAGPYTVRVYPTWVFTLYQPMHCLQSFNMGRNPVAAYYDWWSSTLL